MNVWDESWVYMVAEVEMRFIESLVRRRDSSSCFMRFIPLAMPASMTSAVMLEIKLFFKRSSATMENSSASMVSMVLPMCF